MAIKRHSRVMDRLRELRGDTKFKELASVLPSPKGKGQTKTTANVSSAFRGTSNLLLVDAELIAEKLGGTLEVVVHHDPVNEFIRALDANGLTPQWRETILGAFERAKADAALHRGRGPALSPKQRAV